MKWVLMMLGGMACGLAIRYSIATTPSIQGERSVAALEKISIGGVDQWLLMRSADVTQPVLLFLHGGPGFAEMCLTRQLNGELENDFLVVNWDQRGAGKSFHSGLTDDAMTVEQFLTDTHEVIHYLKERFRQEKIFLVGHSWGSYLGMRIIQAAPDDFYAYIGIGQMINGRRGDTLSYEWTVKMAEADKNEQALRELRTQAAMKDGMFIHGMEEGKHIQRKWLWHYKGFLRNMSRYGLYLKLFAATEYTLLDKLNYMKGIEFSERMLEKEQWLETLTFDKDIQRVAVPIYFMQGRYDYNCPGELVKAFYDAVAAPRKAYIVFEHSAHSPHFEEPEKYHNEMVAIKDALFSQE